MRCFLFLLVFGVANLFASGGLFVETLDEQYSSSNLLSFRFRIHNEQDYLKDAVLKYYLKKDPGKEIVVDRYYPMDSRVNVVEIDSVNVCIEYVLDSVPNGVFPNESGYSIGIRYKDWANRDKYDDFSMPKSSVFSRADNVALFAEGVLVHGNLPDWAEKSESLPDARPYALPDGVKVILEDGRPMRFVWNYVPGAEMYRLMVYSSADTSLVYENVYASNAADVYLPSGDYLWVVHSLASGTESGLNPAPHVPFSDIEPVEVDGMTLTRLHVLVRESNNSSYVESVRIGAPFDTIAASNGRKDTRLLNIGLGELADMYGWDAVHPAPDPTTRPLDPGEGYRCWAIAIQELNHYYTTRDGVHGNLTLDEIIANVKIHIDSVISGGGPALAAFGVGQDNGGNMDEQPYGLSWALNVVASAPYKPATLGWNESFLIDKWKEMLNHGKPIYVTMFGHTMIVDGFRVDSVGANEFHFINTDNYGTSQWRDYGASGLMGSISFIIDFDEPEDVRLTDPDVHKDTDLDGIMDFDEKYRFGSFFDSPDSDGDSIDDKTEIHSYVVRGLTQYTSLGVIERGVVKELLVDVDGDGKRAENDDDSDDDGIKDGEEDVNHNGYVDKGETDPYDANNGPPNNGSSGENEIPRVFALYSFDYMRLNDGVKCQYGFTSGGCTIASEQISESAIVLGTNVNVNAIYSKGRVWLRNNAYVNIIRYYSQPSVNYVTSVQNGAIYNREYNLNIGIWPWNIPEILPKPNSSQYDKLVGSGEAYTLQDGDSFRTLKVEAGGKLYFSGGTMVIDNLQLDARSEIYFNNPEYGTIVHVNKNIKWNGEMKRMNTSISENIFASQVAQCFKLYYHGTETFDVAGLWRGTIVAPNAKLILGQGQYKLIYGQFLAKQIVVHQHSKIVKQEFVKPVAQPSVHQEVALGRYGL